MRSEKAKTDTYPCGVRYLSIKNYPFSWRNAIQLLWVIKGEIEVVVENEHYRLKENQVDIINVNEVYSFHSDKDNRILILDIDAGFFERYYEDAGEVFYYTDEADQEQEKYEIFREYLARIAYEIEKRFDDYEETVEQEALSLMYHLLNEFHYLYYEGGSSIKDAENFQRSHRIVKYISSHFNEKASLRDLADQEFLSSPYLSYKIKETFGESFNEYLNRMRAEESTKLLLDSSLSITEIAQEVGFSHVRYYNKHFEANYGLTPAKYRKKYKRSKRAYEEEHKFQNGTFNEVSEVLHPILLNYSRYEYDDMIFRLDIDLKKEKIDDYKRPDVIDLGNAYLLLEEENQQLFKELERELNLKKVILRGVFSEEMDIYKGFGNHFINWTRVESVMEFLRNLEVEPIILTEGVSNEIVSSFIDYFEDLYPDIREFLIKEQISDSVSPIHPIYDRMEMAIFLLQAFTRKKYSMLVRFVDEITRETRLTNDSFFGDRGLFTNNFLKKPSYYAFMLLSIMGDEIIYQEEGVFVTRSEKGFEILLFHPYISNPEDFFDMGDKIFPEKRFSLNLKNMDSDFFITRYSLNREEGSVYDKWLGLCSPERLDEDEWELMKEYIHPSVRFSYQKKVPIYNFFEKLPAMGAVLYVIKNKNL